MIKRIIYYFFLTALLLTPIKSLLAATTLSVPLPGMNQGVSGPAEYIRGVFLFAISAVGIVALTTLAVGGFMYVASAGNQARQEAAKEIIWGAIGGIIILATSYLLLNTINPDLLKITDPAITVPAAPASGSAAPPTVAQSGTMTEKEARDKLQSAGVSVNKSACSFSGQQDCTSLDNVRKVTIENVVKFKNNCGCEVVITGGTESGHSSGQYSHANGYKIDYRLSTDTDNYIKKNFEPAGTRSDGSPTYKDSQGNTYALEGNHWDVTYYNL